MNFINDILDSDQFCSVRNFIFSTNSNSNTMIWHGTGCNGKSTLCHTISNPVFISTKTFNTSIVHKFNKNSIFILSDVDNHHTQDIHNIIHHIRMYYQHSKLLIITNYSRLLNELADDTIISIFFKYQFVKHINTPNDKIVNYHILDQLNTKNLWIKV